MNYHPVLFTIMNSWYKFLCCPVNPLLLIYLKEGKKYHAENNQRNFNEVAVSPVQP
jgi:hypothetical protein